MKLNLAMIFLSPRKPQLPFGRGIFDQFLTSKEIPAITHHCEDTVGAWKARMSANAGLIFNCTIRL
jgi:hypothetical protein